MAGERDPRHPYWHFSDSYDLYSMYHVPYNMCMVWLCFALLWFYHLYLMDPCDVLISGVFPAKLLSCECHKPINDKSILFQIMAKGG